MLLCWGAKNGATCCRHAFWSGPIFGRRGVGSRRQQFYESNSFEAGSLLVSGNSFGERQSVGLSSRAAGGSCSRCSCHVLLLLMTHRWRAGCGAAAAGMAPFTGAESAMCGPLAAPHAGAHVPAATYTARRWAPLVAAGGPPPHEVVCLQGRGLLVAFGRVRGSAEGAALY